MAVIDERRRNIIAAMMARSNLGFLADEADELRTIGALKRTRDVPTLETCCDWFLGRYAENEDDEEMFYGECQNWLWDQERDPAAYEEGGVFANVAEKYERVRE